MITLPPRTHTLPPGDLYSGTRRWRNAPDPGMCTVRNKFRCNSCLRGGFHTNNSRQLLKCTMAHLAASTLSVNLGLYSSLNVLLHFPVISSENLLQVFLDVRTPENELHVVSLAVPGHGSILLTEVTLAGMYLKEVAMGMVGYTTRGTGGRERATVRSTRKNFEPLRPSYYSFEIVAPCATLQFQKRLERRKRVRSRPG